MKYFSLIVLFILVSCGNKEDILLPKSNTTIVKNVIDHSPIYIFFRTKAKDTLAEVNRKNEIISTNWIFNIDKRLPLRLVVPEVVKLQNYYSYADTIGKNLAFIPFTKVFYKLEKPKSGIVVLFNKNNEVLVNNVIIKKDELQEYFNKLPSDKPNQHVFCFDKDLSFGTYIQDKIFIESLKLDTKSNQEFIY
jgi:hypothetical protein